ncbi:hypothetical protein [Bacillus sp. KH172YL63]|uniref:hypothetical protein n=1 Tax=Bacillus sp. KH172YL63 TaxID=2709784 RepID=UPI0013E505F8|nr:hypothetical protein [Bacillus sp. KH172YL63]BCB03614.1 hypothetical protein KH172YL63_17470 [Bacillus sp. KH172YL63]
MYYYFNVLLTIVILLIGTGVAFFIDGFSKQMERWIPKKFLSLTIILILFMLMSAATKMISMQIGWSLFDTAFISSLCFFGLGWMTHISARAHINQAGTVAKFITNNQFKYEYEAASSSNRSPYLIASLLFLGISWGLSFWMVYM